MNDDYYDEVFDSHKGYRELGRDPDFREEARDAYYQGFITDYERNMLMTGRMIIDNQANLVWLWTDKPKRRLTRLRMLEIQRDQLMGISDGTTSL